MVAIEPKPTRPEVMFQLERMIHQWDETHEDGYHPDALWLEEVRHIITTQEKEKAMLAKLAAETPQFFNPLEAMAAKKTAR